MKIRSEVQKLILEKALNGPFYLEELKEEVQKLVKYRPSAALSQNAIVLENMGLIRRYKEGKKVKVELDVERFLEEQVKVVKEALKMMFKANPEKARDLVRKAIAEIFLE